MLIGKDTRISGYMLESALQAGLSAAGVLGTDHVRLMAAKPLFIGGTSSNAGKSWMATAVCACVAAV